MSVDEMTFDKNLRRRKKWKKNVIRGVCTKISFHIKMRIRKFYKKREGGSERI